MICREDIHRIYCIYYVISNHWKYYVNALDIYIPIATLLNQFNIISIGNIKYNISNVLIQYIHFFYLSFSIFLYPFPPQYPLSLYV